jgi:hypothetical protein
MLNTFENLIILQKYQENNSNMKIIASYGKLTWLGHNIHATNM